MKKAEAKIAIGKSDPELNGDEKNESLKDHDEKS